MAESFQDRFWTFVCPYKQIWFSLLGVETTLLFLLLFSVWFGIPDPYTEAIVIVDLAIVGVGIVLSSIVLLHCRRRERENRQQ